MSEGGTLLRGEPLTVGTLLTLLGPLNPLMPVRIEMQINHMPEATTVSLICVDFQDSIVLSCL